MLVAILQALLKFVLRLGIIFGLAFMVACTVFVIYCIVHGDIKINLTKDRANKEKNEKVAKEMQKYIVDSLKLCLSTDITNKYYKEKGDYKNARYS